MVSTQEFLFVSARKRAENAPEENKNKKLGGPNGNVNFIVVGTAYQNLVQNFVIFTTKCNREVERRCCSSRRLKFEMILDSTTIFCHGAGLDGFNIVSSAIIIFSWILSSMDDIYTSRA